MAIKELTAEQVHAWSLEEKDRWWLQNVYRGNMPQLTIRSALTGMLLGGLLSLTNLYVGAKTGWTLGVGITSVILAFAMFKVLSKMQLARAFTILENNAMQSIATAAGYMTSPMISSLAAYMWFTGEIIPMWQTMAWISVLAILGVLFAFPFKRRFINDEQQPFPEGRAAGVVMDALHHGEAEAGMLKARLLLIFAGVAAFVRLSMSAVLMGLMNLNHLPEFLDNLFYSDKDKTAPTIMGTSLPALTIQFPVELPLLGAGGLIGIRTGVSILLGALVNYALLVPIMINRGDITPDETGEITFRRITFWALWCGVSMMTVASLVLLFAKPQIIVGAFRKLFGRRAPGSDVLRHIELPLSVSAIGIPLVGILVAWMASSFFGIHWSMTLLALVLVFLLSLIAINSTGQTSITPISAMGKITQLTFGVAAPRDTGVNLATAGIAGEVASHSANLLQDIKPGYMLGAKPRQQAIGHVLGVIAGALLAVPIFYLAFIRDGKQNLTPAQAFSTTPTRAHDLNFGEGNTMPSAVTWKAVADILREGIRTIPESARWAALIGAILGLGLEWLRIGTRGRFPLVPIGIGLGFVIQFHSAFIMFLGAFIFWVLGKCCPRPDSATNRIFVQNQEPICAGLIAGGALMGIAVMVTEVSLPGGGH